MLLQELGDRHVGLQFRQNLVKAAGVRIRWFVSREHSIRSIPSPALDRQQRESRLAQ
jgi:hypothetical protein